ncbi:MAG: glycoside hydrolase family 2 protein [Bacteroidales bacterium]|nr:glycoside hydrolase family 2 protein [Bacteroidales bacterium]
MKTKFWFFSIIILIVFILTYCQREDETSGKIIVLNSNWKFQKAGETDWMDAEIPGTLHTDLLTNEIIEDPFYRSNEKDLQWIETENWDYKNTFFIDSSVLKMNNIELIFEGIDTYADVFLNNTLILQADNMFREWNVNCKKYLKEGENSLLLKFYSPVTIDSIKASKHKYNLPDQRAYSRKAPYQYGWDWGPRFVSFGIWKPVYIQIWDELKISDIQIIQKKITKETAHLTAIFEVELASSLEVELSIENLENSEIYFSRKESFFKGTNKIRINFSIDEPKLWWTNGLGEAHLYQLLAKVEINEELFEEKNFRIGIRDLEVIREKDSIGRSFYFKLNGYPVFMKGANYIPQDNFLPRVMPDQYDWLINSAVDANMNMLRVWGGGIYEDEIFYDYCDENGILVWQDFMFACTMYPGDSNFIESVRQEACTTIKRLRNHPCLAIWCGNNEVDEGWHNWGWQKALNYSYQDSTEIWENYKKVFHDILPNAVEKYDSQRFYWPSSPKIGWGHAESLEDGDSHYWGVWWGEQEFEIYEEKVGRFMSEYGFQSYPDIKTIESFTETIDRNFESEAMQTHQKHPRGHELIQLYMERDYNPPTDFESYVYVSQLLQAYGIKKAIEAHRRAMPRCMGTLYWQLNDCWPVASWSSIDYYGRWKALHYFVKKAYNETLISPHIENEKLKVFIISDKLEAENCKMELSLIDFSGKNLWGESVAVKINANSSEVYFEISLNNLLKNYNKKEIVFNAKITSEGNILTENNLYFLPFKELDLPKPQIKKTIKKDKNIYIIELTTDLLAKNVLLSLNDADGFFTDNYFDIIPGEVKIVLLASEQKIADPKNQIEVRSLGDQ